MTRFNPWSWLHARLSAFHVPPEMHAQSPSMGEALPYEDVLEDDFERPVVLLSDGSVALVWRLSPLSHEVLTNEQVAERARGVARVFDALTEPDQVVQLLFDAAPSWEVDKPAYLQPDGPQTVAQEVLDYRIRHVEMLAAGALLGRSEFRTMQRQLHLTLRMAGMDRKPGLKAALQRGLLGVAAAEEEAARQFLAAVRRLLDAGLQLEEGLETLGLAPTPCGGTEVLTLLRRAWHDEDELVANPCVRRPYDPDRRLGAQVCKGFVQQNRAGVQVGRDTWEVISWMEQPQQVPMGLFSLLLGFGLPLRCVVVLRPCLETTDLTLAKTQLSAPLLHSERKVRHMEELRYVEERQVHGEKLFWVGLHLLVKNEGVSLQELEHQGAARSVAHAIAQASDIELVVERDATAALFLLCQPLAYSPGTAWFTGRERRVLTSALGPYLPLFGGFQGQQKAVHRVQLLHSRAADPLWLDIRRNETSPHVAVLASTGAGKSFWLANLLCSEAAAHPDALFFVLDSLTSYQVLGEVLGEEGGFSLVKPPASMPNIWEGELSDERLGVIVGLLRAAIGLVDPTFVFRNEHGTLLEGAIRKAFADQRLEASTALGAQDLFEVAGGRALRPLPRLSDVIANLAVVAAERDVPSAAVAALSLQLSAFVGDGRYARFFDAPSRALPSAPTPKVTLYDFGSIEDATVRSLTLFVCVAEVVRQVMRPENRGRPGVLLVDEAGVLLSQPGEAGAELVKFVQTAWKTFRKLGVACIGSTNEPADYSEKAGPKTIWFNSPTKVFLRLKPEDQQLARLEDPSKGRPALIKDPLVGELVTSLRKVDGAYSQGMFVSDETRGTFTYIAGGHDYWLAASKPVEVATFLAVAQRLSSKRLALHWLAERFPAGARDETNAVRALSEEEMPS
jgi:hypothetical protein